MEDRYITFMNDEALKYLMNQEEMINILNQHGFDVLYKVFQDSISHAYSDGFAIGYNDGWNECYDILTGEDYE